LNSPAISNQWPECQRPSYSSPLCLIDGHVAAASPRNIRMENKKHLKGKIALVTGVGHLSPDRQ
jgi:hypothetical protein